MPRTSSQHQAYAPQPISRQPEWTPLTLANSPACPPGLEYLSQVDRLMVIQKVELVEAFTGFETNNKYTIFDGLGRQVYFAKEHNDWCNRTFCGNMRSFEMSIYDNTEQEVIHISRPLACMGCCCPCCLQTMQVFAGGVLVGTIEEQWSCCSPKFRVLNARDEIVLNIKGPVCCKCSCCGDVEYKVLNLEGAEIGCISKKWSGFAQEMYTDADNFGIQFPVDLSVETKATLLAATFLIDFMYFEENNVKTK